MAERRRILASLWQLVLVRFREFYREPEAIFWVIVFPILMAGGLGVAFRNRPPEIVSIGLRIDLPNSAGLPQALSRAQKMAVALVDSAQGENLLRTGAIALLVIPDNSGDLRLRYGPTRTDALIARALANDRLQRMFGREDPVRVVDDLIDETGSRYIDFLIPGLIGMNLLSSGVWGIGYAIVDARRRKLLKRLVATPMSRAEYLGSFLLARLAFLVLEVGVVLAFGMLVFDVPLNGSLFSLAAVSVLAALTFGGIGLLTASRAQTVEGASGLMNVVMLPMWIFSGVFFATSRFPEVMQPVIHALPLTAANDALRGVILNGLPLVAVGGELLILTAWLVVTYGVALRIFRWR